MVRTLLIISLAVLPSLSWALDKEVNGITADQLRLIASDADRAKRKKASRVDPTKMSSFLDNLYPPEKSKSVLEDIVPVKDRKTEAENKFNYNDLSNTNSAQASENEVNKDKIEESTKAALVESNQSQDKSIRSSKYSQSAVNVPKQSKNNNKVSTQNKRASLQASKPHTDGFIYVAPARTANGNVTASNHSDASKQGKRKFGIRIGTWIKGSLNRSTTNSDPGLIEIHVTEEVQGDYRALPTGSILFCRKGFNQGTRRLDMEITRAILPSGEELDLTALIYDEQREAGLRGIVIENQNSSVTSGMVDGVLNAGKRLASLGSDSAAGIIIDSTVGSVTNDQKQVHDARKKPSAYTIHVPAQSVLIQIQTTF